MFAAMLESLKYEVISTLSKVQVRMPEEVEELEQQRRMEAERLAQMQQLSHQLSLIHISEPTRPY